MLRPPKVMNISPQNRRSLRLPEYDYGSAGVYFVTICTKDRRLLFGEIDHGAITLNDLGEIVTACWSDLPNHFPKIQLDCMIVMPNHIHGLIEIDNDRTANPVGAQRAAPIPETAVRQPHSNIQPGSLAAIVRSFKAAPTQRVNLLTGKPGATIWQRNYYEHVVRDYAELQRVREYIVNNPVRWAEDEENPDVLRPAGQRSKG